MVYLRHTHTHTHGHTHTYSPTRNVNTITIHSQCLCHDRACVHSCMHAYEAQMMCVMYCIYVCGQRQGRSRGLPVSNRRVPCGVWRWRTENRGWRLEVGTMATISPIAVVAMTAYRLLDHCWTSVWLAEVGEVK